MQDISLRDVRQFVNEKLGLGKRIAALRDGRRKPQISATTVFEAVLYGTLVGAESLLAVDQLLKQSDLGEVLGIERSPLVSDSTMIRCLGTMKPEAIRALLRIAACEALKMALLEGEPLRLGRYRVVAVDMSHMAGRKAVVARYVGPAFEVTLDFEILRKKENEVTAAKRLFERIVSELGDLFDVVVVDGLYTQWFIQRARQVGKHVVVKSREKEKNFTLVRRGEQWIRVHRRYGVHPTAGVDEDGYKSYRYMEIDPQTDELLAEPIRMVKVWEERIKGRQERDEHWLLSTLPREEAAPELLRHIARRRWGIENGAFRTVSQNHKAKRRGTQQGKAAEVRVGILLLSEMILRVYTWYKQTRWKSPRSRRASWQSVQKLLLRSIPPLREVRGLRPVGQPHWGLQSIRQPMRPTGTDPSG